MQLEDIILDIYNENIMKKTPKLVVLKLPNNYDLKYLYNKVNNKCKIFLYNLNKMFIIVLESKNIENLDNLYLTSSSLVNPSSETLSPKTSISDFSEAL